MPGRIFGGCEGDAMKLLAYAAVIAALIVAIVLLMPGGNSQAFEPGFGFADPYPGMENMSIGRVKMNKQRFDVGFGYADSDQYPGMENLGGGGRRSHHKSYNRLAPRQGFIQHKGNGDNFEPGFGYATSDQYPGMENIMGSRGKKRQGFEPGFGYADSDQYPGMENLASKNPFPAIHGPPKRPEGFAWGPVTPSMPVITTGEATGTSLQSQLYYGGI